MKKRLPLTYLVLAGATLVMAGGVFFTLLELKNEVTHEARGFRESLLWMAGQIEREARTLRDVLGRFREGDPAISRDDVIERFDVVWSRLETADEGYVGRYLMTLEGARETIESSRAMLRDVEPLVMNLTRGDNDSLSIRRRLDEAIRAFHRLTVRAMHWQETRLENERARILSILWKTLFMLGGTLLSGSVLVGMVLSRQRSLEDLRGTLEKRIEERTELLRESEERHRRFAADVAHELRTPLAVLHSNLDSLEDAEIARSLRRDVDAMTRLVEQLLALARLDFLEIDSTDQADLREVCTNVASHLAPLAIKNKRSIQVSGCNGPVIIRGNTDSLEQAVRNLVENSLRYSHRGSAVTLKIGDDATISVIDKGPGIPPEQRDEIFERFVRPDRRSAGAGLGLSIVRRTVDAHDGKIEIADTPGGGVTFTMRFPAANPMLL